MERSAGLAQAARSWHGLTVLVALVALVVQVGLVISGASVLVTSGPAPSTALRLVRFFGYFTIQSNLFVLITGIALMLDPARDGRVWRVIRLDALVGITVTGIVHWFLLRPILDLHGLSALTDKLLHVVVPLLAMIGWLMFGPRPRIKAAVLLPALIWPLLYMVYTVIFGAISDWYPYPFVDVGLHGYPTVLANAVGVLALFLATSLVLLVLDRRLPATASNRVTGAGPLPR